MMAQANAPPPIDYEFDFNLPHGVDIDDYPIERASDSGSLDKDDPEQEDRDSLEINDSLMSDILHPQTNNSSPKHQVQGDVGKRMYYDQLPEGISEDEDASKAFDRSWSGRETTRTAPKTKVSPRRKHEDDTEEKMLRSKKPRQSLLGGPVEEDEDKRAEGDSMDEADNERIPQTSGKGISPRMSSLSLKPQETERSMSNGPFNVGFGIPGSKQGDVPSPISPALAGDNVIIPPDSRVGVSPN
ncbi:hypothetical protein J1614_004906 [Plenodomus biglobosus]|nr:hypothetical protein J1614_004906 [Plenodomus biglobosus]